MTGETAITRAFADGLTLALDQEITTASLRSWVNDYVGAATGVTSDHVSGSLPAVRQTAEDETSYLRSRMWLVFAPTWSAPRPGPTTVSYPYRLLQVDTATNERTVLERTLSVTFGANSTPTPFPALAPVEVVAAEGQMILFLDAQPTADGRVWNPDAPVCLAAAALP